MTTNCLDICKSNEGIDLKELAFCMRATDGALDRPFWMYLKNLGVPKVFKKFELLKTLNLEAFGII